MIKLHTPQPIKKVYMRLKAVLNKLFSPIIRFIKKIFGPLYYQLLTTHYALQKRYPFLRTLWFRSLMVTLSLLILLPSVTIIVDNVLKNRTYTLSKDVSALIGKSTVDTKLIKTTDTAFTYNRAEESNAPEDIQKVLEIAAKKEDATGKKPYQAELAKDASDGITFSDSEGDRSFKLVPQHNTANARLDDEGRVIYPNGSNEKHIYSFKTNGIKSDIVLTEAPKDNTKDYTWELELGTQLEARMLPDGGVGIYSADPTLFGENLQIGDQKSQDLIDKARKNGQKNTLAFELPKPFIVDANNNKNYEDVNYTLDGTTLTLQSRNLQKQSYPLSIDPTIVVTTTSDFQQKTGDTGNTDFGTDGQINRGLIANGAVGNTWATTATFTTARNDHTTVVYNGRMYLMGGWDGATYYSDVRYAPINANGTLSAWNITTSFTTPRYGHTSVAYNGYLYVIGGYHATSDTACNGTASNYCSDVQYAPINANGTIGSWTAATSFTAARYGHTSVAYNGYLYAIGGREAATYLDSVQYAPINADGTIGTWTATTSFTTARSGHTSVAYNGYLYVLWGGSYSGPLDSVQYAPINADGTLGTWTATTSLTTYRQNHTSVAYDGYIYVIGGYHATSDTACNATASNYCSDVQYAPINADGTLGTWTATTSFTTARESHTSVAYNGYLYTMGGWNGTTRYNDVQYAKITLGASSKYTATTSFTTARTLHTSVAYNGYLYVIGGGDASDLNDVQYALINANGTVGTWAATTSFTTARSGHTSVAYNGYLYVIGGNNGSYLNNVQYAFICDSTATGGCTAGAGNIGKVGTWTSTTAFTTARYDHTSVAYNGYLYVIGGENGPFLNDVQYAPINSNGTIGTWTTTTSYNTARRGLASVAYNGYLYITGGWDGNYFSDVQYAPINSNGTIGTWTTTTSYTTGRSRHELVVYNGFLYVNGGSASPGGNLNDVQYAPINSNGTIGNWTSTSGFTTVRDGHTSVAYNGFLYVIGGDMDVGSYLNDVQYARIGQSNSAGAWSLTTSLSAPLSTHKSLAYNGFLYVLGGHKTSASTADVLYAPINTNGTIGAWTATTSFSTARETHSAEVYNGYLYVLGGWHDTLDTACSATNGYYCSDVQYSLICTGANSGVGGCGATAGTVGSWTTTTSLNIPRSSHVSLAYNGFMYVIGGYNDIGDTSCSVVAGYYCTDVMFASINSNGTLGSWTATTNFNVGRLNHNAIIYNGYMYIMGGEHATNDTACNNTATNYCSDVQYAPVNSNGTLGSWQYTNIMNVARTLFATYVNNGYIYVVGGYHNANDAACNSVASFLCSDVQFAQINSNGTIGLWSKLSTINVARQDFSLSTYNGFAYIIGGSHLTVDTACNPTAFLGCSDVQYAPLLTNDYKARYERNFDTGSAGNIMNSFTIVGTAQCKYTVTYKTAGSDGVLGSATTLYNVTPGVSQTLNISSKRYVYMAATMDDSTCGGQSNITSISLNYNSAPDAPTLVLPANSAIAVNVLPEFRLGSADDFDAYVQYKIELCTTNDCSSILRTINQAVSQVGWTSQSQNSGTAYAGGSTAITQYGIHQYQPTALSGNTQYWWRAQAIDPGGTNQWSAYSTIGTFTTGAALPPAQMNIGGGTTIYGGTNFSTGN